MFTDDATGGGGSGPSPATIYRYERGSALLLVFPI